MSFELFFYSLDHHLILLLMLALLVGACEFGFRAGSRKKDSTETFRALMSGIGAATFGLLALLLGFTLAMVIGGWDTRRDVLIAESNAIGTLSLRAGLFEESVRDPLRASLQEYTDARIALAKSGGDLDQFRAARQKSEALQPEIWSTVERAGTLETSPAKLSSLIAAANELIDIHELRLSAVESFLPASLMLLLLGVAGVSIYFLAWSFGAAGHGGRTAMLLLVLLVASVLFLIMDINRPQRGTFQVGVDTLERVQNSIPASTAP